MQKVEKLLNSASQHQGEIATGAALTTSSGVVLIGSLSIHDWASVIGMIGVIVTIGINLYFKITDRKQNLREKKRRK